MEEEQQVEGARVGWGRRIQLPRDACDPLDVIEARGAVEILIERTEERFQPQLQIAVHFGRGVSHHCPVLKPGVFESVQSNEMEGIRMRLAAIAAVAALVTLPAVAGGLFDDDECKYTAKRHVATPASGITKIVVHGESGSLDVNGAAGVTQIVADGTACTSESDFLPRMTLSLRKIGSELHVDANIPEKTVVFGFFSARLDFTVTIPAGLPVEIDDGSGWLKVTNTGATEIEDGSGSIEVRNVRGQLTIHDGSGSIDVDTVSGNVEIEDDSGEMTVRNVTGSVEIEDGSGSISVARVEGSLRIRGDGSGSITVQNIRRDVTIDEDGSGSIEVADVGGNFTVGRDGSGGIDYERISGRVSVPSRR
jgi:hypothetical protein